MKKKSFIQKNGLVAVWSMAGFIAMGYIGFLATGTGSQRSNSTMVAQRNLANSPVATPVQQEVAVLRAHVKELTSREKKLSRKLSNLEEALGPNTAALPSQSTEFDLRNSAKNINSLSSNGKPSKKVTINVLPLTVDDNVMQLSAGPQTKSYGIDLASARSIDSLERHWRNLKKSNPALLKGLKAHFVDKGTTDLPLYSLIAGPFERMSVAVGHCKKMSNANIDCQETNFQHGGKLKITTAER
ncbi:MAG: SPOR domain-containing protein [bacterium]|nr:SPOR domain-containing protein [bacterium]